MRCAAPFLALGLFMHGMAGDPVGHRGTGAKVSWILFGEDEPPSSLSEDTLARYLGMDAATLAEAIERSNRRALKPGIPGALPWDIHACAILARHNWEFRRLRAFAAVYFGMSARPSEDFKPSLQSLERFLAAEGMTCRMDTFHQAARHQEIPDRWLRKTFESICLDLFHLRILHGAARAHAKVHQAPSGPVVDLWQLPKLSKLLSAPEQEILGSPEWCRNALDHLEETLPGVANPRLRTRLEHMLQHLRQTLEAFEKEQPSLEARLRAVEDWAHPQAQP